MLCYEDDYVRRNLKITLSYDGSEFRGWQIQPGLPTVQGILADCLERITSEKVLPQGSGRTDAGVHALAQVASLFLESPIPEWNLLVVLNDVLPPSIRVTGVERVEDSFHARHSATAKTYRYRIYREKICPPFLARFTSFAASDPERSARLATRLGTRRTERARLGVVEQELAEVAAGGADLDADDEDATDDLTIKHRNVRTIHSSLWARTPEEFSYTVRGNGFLHHMVRNLVGTFLQVGKGSLKPDDIPAILAAKNRSAAGATAPACGLYLVSVEYVTP
jgi:tRNA pseudouridine38-40 synthase